MTVDRRQLLRRGGALSAWALAQKERPAGAAPTGAPAGPLAWPAVRAEFDLDPAWVHLGLLLITSHPRVVRQAIERHRRAMDANPVVYGMENFERLENESRSAAAACLGVPPEEVALTGNTTTGLAVVYGGLPLRPGQEIVTTTHDHYATHEALRLRAVHTGARFRKIELYAKPAQASEDEIVGKFVAGIGKRTRVAAVTWVHSSTGVKLPIRRMANALADVNRRRDERDRVLLCVDGVHGFGVEDETMASLGCDFFAAGCHKWLFGPRGTGVLWGRAEAWKGHAGIVPSFDMAAFHAWMEGHSPDRVPPGPLASPGGFHAFEHRWALADAFRFHQQLGRARVAARVHELARRCKEGLAALPHVTLHTPHSEALSAGLVCFEVKGLTPKQVVERLLAKKIVGTTTPYATSYARLTPGILNAPEDVDRAVAAVGEMRA